MSLDRATRASSFSRGEQRSARLQSLATEAVAWRSPPRTGFDRDPTERRARVMLPLGLLWHRRWVDVLPASQYRISVPVSGGPPPANGSAVMQQALESMWVQYPRDGGLRASAVVVTIATDADQPAPAGHLLTVLVGVLALPVDRAIDSVNMARNLRTALARISLDPRSI